MSIDIDCSDTSNIEAGLDECEPLEHEDEAEATSDPQQDEDDSSELGFDEDSVAWATGQTSFINFELQPAPYNEDPDFSNYDNQVSGNRALGFGIDFGIEVGRGIACSVAASGTFAAITAVAATATIAAPALLVGGGALLAAGLVGAGVNMATAALCNQVSGNPQRYALGNEAVTGFFTGLASPLIAGSSLAAKFAFDVSKDTIAETVSFGINAARNDEFQALNGAQITGRIAGAAAGSFAANAVFGTGLEVSSSSIKRLFRSLETGKVNPIHSRPILEQGFARNGSDLKRTSTAEERQIATDLLNGFNQDQNFTAPKIFPSKEAAASFYAAQQHAWIAHIRPHDRNIADFELHTVLGTNPYGEIVGLPLEIGDFNSVSASQFKGILIAAQKLNLDQCIHIHTHPTTGYGVRTPHFSPADVRSSVDKIDFASRESWVIDWGYQIFYEGGKLNPIDRMAYRIQVVGEVYNPNINGWSRQVDAFIDNLDGHKIVSTFPVTAITNARAWSGYDFDVYVAAPNVANASTSHTIREGSTPFRVTYHFLNSTKGDDYH